MSYYDYTLIHCIFEIYFVFNQISFQNRSATTQFVAYWFWYKSQNEYAIVSKRHILVIVLQTDQILSVLGSQLYK